MDAERRRFLQMLGTLCGAGVARTLGLGAKAGTYAAAASTTAVAASATAPIAVLSSPYGSGIRQQVLEVIVRQAVAGAPWKEICKGPMQVNGITIEEVEAEVARRKSKTHCESPACNCEKCEKVTTKRVLGVRARLNAIPHSPLSPCACNQCRTAVNKTIQEIFSKEYD
ncbi:MAG: hypothetical protein JSS83_19000 [Cyanobacteria bacterium SZAS LIN-3]|nr:hypothetical protein [Cyanobacteria bacterium SZAS LIN-3]